MKTVCRELQPTKAMRRSLFDCTKSHKVECMTGCFTLTSGLLLLTGNFEARSVSTTAWQVVEQNDDWTKEVNPN